jgi:predicted Co/Zn/Cd cation transporter (cation efflux family)
MGDQDDNQLSEHAAIERRSLGTGKWASLLMAVAGIAASYASRSDALLVDGLYSGVNFISAIIAARISASILRAPDRRYPFGYDAYEALYVKYRSLVLLGIIAYAAFGAVSKIIIYASGQPVPELVFGPILVYTVLMVVICFGLAWWHNHNWQRSGRRSELLLIESRAAIIDGVISAGAGAGLLSATLLFGTSLEFLVPIADSIIVLLMSAFIVREPLRTFLGSLREVAGGSADPKTWKKVHDRIEELFNDRPFTLLDVAVTKLGRAYLAVAYVKPDDPVSGEQADALREEIETVCKKLLQGTKAELVIAATPPWQK